MTLELLLVIFQVLYNKDCISDQAIIYWHQKGSKPQGRQHFLNATQSLVKVRQISVDGKITLLIYLDVTVLTRTRQ